MNALSETMLARSSMYNTVNQIPVDPSRPGGIPVAIDELQKIVHGLEELTIGLRSRLLPVLRDEPNRQSDTISSAPPVEPLRAPLDHQLRGIGRQLQEVSANIDDILKHLEV